MPAAWVTWLKYDPAWQWQHYEKHLYFHTQSGNPWSSTWRQWLANYTRCVKLGEQASTLLLTVCSSHRSGSVYICNMRHWQVLQLQQHLHACICCSTWNNDSNNGSTCYSSSSIAFPIPSAACSSNNHDSTCSTRRSTCTTCSSSSNRSSIQYAKQKGCLNPLQV